MFFVIIKIYFICCHSTAVIQSFKYKSWDLNFHKLAWPSHEWITELRSTAQRQSHPLKPTPKVQETLMWWTIFRLEYDFALTVLAQNAQKIIPRKIKVYYSNISTTTSQIFSEID